MKMGNRSVTFVSIQLGSPASGDILVDVVVGVGLWKVSIQLGSPASGDEHCSDVKRCRINSGFHSIRIPSEWGYYQRPCFP